MSEVRVAIRIDDEGTPVQSEVPIADGVTMVPGRAYLVDGDEYAVKMELATSTLVLLGENEDAPQPAGALSFMEPAPE